MAASSSDSNRVRITLSTEHEEFKIPDNISTVLVSTNLRRIQLSTLVNSLLESSSPVPFEFLINGHFLRTSLDKFLTTHGISAETTLSVEYVRALVPPSNTSTLPHEDWVSSVDVASSVILSGSFDGRLRIWNESAQLVATSEKASSGALAAIKCARFAGPTQIVSGHLDRAVRLWSYDAGSLSTDAALTPTLELYGHLSSVDSLAVDAKSKHILTGSADHTVGLWSTQAEDAPEAAPGLIPDSSSSSKRRKTAKSGAIPADVTKRGPLAILRAHSASVTDVMFASSTVAYSVSHDRTLRTWDLLVAGESGPEGDAAVSSRTVTAPLLSVCALPAVNVLAAGTSDRTIVLIDPREGATRAVARTLRGHTGWVSKLSACPTSAHGLASASYDGTVRVWDVRGGGAEVGNVVSTTDDSVFTIPREAGKTAQQAGAGQATKVFDVVWDRVVGVVSGGEDNKVQVNSIDAH